MSNNKIRITEKGTEIVENSYKIFEEIDNDVFESFTNEEITLLNDILDKMQSNLMKKNEECNCERKKYEKYLHAKKRRSST
jgi:hypothetical protein